MVNRIFRLLAALAMGFVSGWGLHGIAHTPTDGQLHLALSQGSVGALGFNSIAPGSVTRVTGDAYVDRPLHLARPEFQLSLARAREAWRESIPQAIIPTPILYEGTTAACENPYAIACADSAEDRIVISLPVRECNCDMDTVLMHELGHLMGVPHIEGDRLMNSSYMEKVAAPTAQAIALARLHQNEKKGNNE